MHGPTHPLHSRFSHLLKDVKSFAEYEQRVKVLDEEYDRGYSFEVFVEAYFMTKQGNFKFVKDVYPLNAVPLAIRDKFRLPKTDAGIDFIIQRASGEYVAVQVKFHSDKDKAVSWTESAHILALADRFDERVLISNALSISKHTDDRMNFYSVLGNEFISLTESDFRVMYEWLSTGHFVRPVPHSPRPFQKDAINSILDGFESNDRVQVTMACGSGKTNVALWATERFIENRKEPTNVLVLVPSLALMNQMINCWMIMTKLDNLDFIAVCSGSDVGKNYDDLQTSEKELPFRKVSTDPKEIRKFFKTPFNGTRIVFSTYQSAPVVKEGMSRNTIFHIGIFDEAHKTASRSEGLFSFALNEKNLKIEKRLFMTATPRQYNVLKRDKFGNKKKVFSMDDETAYGPVVYNLSFNRAVNLGIIVPYKVIISIVNSSDKRFKKKVWGKGKTRLKRKDGIEEEIYANQVAKQLVIKQAADEYGIKKVLAFHNTINASKSFISPDLEGLNTHLKDWAVDHIAGTMPTNERIERIAILNEDKPALVSNARCLTEGVDIPAVDAVAFMTPKKSDIDIVQAAGRAMRISKGKDCAYIVVPLFLDLKKKENFDDAALRTKMNHIWYILNTLLSQDEAWVQMISEIRQSKGSTGGYSGLSGLSSRISFAGAQGFTLDFINFEKLKTSILIQCIDTFSDDWDELYGADFEYRKGNLEKINDGIIPVGTKFNEKNIYQFEIAMREYLRDKRPCLTKARIEKMNNLPGGFNWNGRKNYFNTRFEKELAIFKKTGKRTRWMITQCIDLFRDNTNGRLFSDKMKNEDLPGRREMFIKAGIPTFNRKTFYSRFDEEIKYKKENGKWSNSDFVQRIRLRKRKDELSKEQIEYANKSSFDWSYSGRSFSWRSTKQRQLENQNGSHSR